MLRMFVTCLLDRGITENEIELFKSAGAVPVTLGKRILRTETAAIATVSALMCLLGQWE